jgi:uroporphyrinogen decarboxylase
MNKPILKILSKSKNISDTPIWLMRQAGRYLPEYQKVRKDAKHFLDLCYNPELAAEVTLQPIRRFDLDAAIIFSDILVIPDSMGIKVMFKENLGPVLEPIQTKEEMDRAFSRRKIDKLNPVYEAIEIVKMNLPEDVALIGFAGGAWTLASYIVEGKLSKDFSTVKSTYYNYKIFFNKLMDHLVENIAQHLINQVKAGVEIVQIFDSWAGMLGGEDYEELIIKPTQAIIEKVRKIYPNISIICFPRMSGLNYEKFCNNVDCQAISVDQYIPLNWLKGFKGQKIIQGNLDPLVLLSNSKDFIRKRVDNIFDQMGSDNFIFNLGHGVVPKTDPDNVEFLINYIKSRNG